MFLASGSRTLTLLGLACVLTSGCNRQSSADAPDTSTPPATVTSTPTPAPASTVSEPDPTPVSPRFVTASQARISGKYATVILADGDRVIVPLSSLSESDLTWLTTLADTQPFEGKSTVVIAKPTVAVKVKKTIEVSKIENGLETVQLCAPAIFRDQIGATCMIYARVHWLDIAGHYRDHGDIYRIINDVPTDQPWLSSKFVNGLTSIETGFNPKPVSHRAPAGGDAFAWARAELRKGRVILAAFPTEIWRALPPNFVASRPWSGGSIGHQIVINGFTWNARTGEGSFHIVNSWKELPEFDIDLDAVDSTTLSIERSLSPVGEIPPKVEKEVVTSVVLIRSAGSTNLYRVTTNLGTRDIVAPDEAAARALAEQATP